MLTAVYLPSTREIRVRGTADAYEDLIAVIETGAGSASCEAEDERREDVPPRVDRRAPHTDVALGLAVVVIWVAEDPELRVILRVESPGLVIIGGRDYLRALARDFEQLRHADPGDRLESAWFPGHAYLRAGSLPTVFIRA